MEQENNIPEAAKQFTMSTTSDMHFDMLADPTKLRMMPPNLIDKKEETIIEDVSKGSDSESSDSSKPVENISTDDNNSSSESPKFYEDESPQQANNHPNLVNNNFSNVNNNQSFNSFSDEKIPEPRQQIPQTNNYAKSHSQSQNQSQFPTLYNNMGDEMQFKSLDPQAQRMAKMEKYAELLSIKRSGISLTKEYNINSDYNEMCFEVNYWNNFQKKKDAVELGKNFMVNAITALEFLNESYDPFGLKLKGWSESVELNKSSYTSVFEELYEKYKMSGRKLEPELKLLFMVSASAASFHASKKMAESLPGLDSVLQGNPDLLSKLQGAINSQISGDAAKEKEKDEREEQQRKMYQQMKELKAQQAKFEELQKAQETVNNNTEKIRQQMDMMNKSSGSKAQPKQEKPDITSILNKIKAQNAAKKADEVLNNKLSDSSEEENISLDEKKDDEDPSDSYTGTIGSDGKPTRRKRNAKSTISIITK